MKAEDEIFLIVDDEPDMCWALEHILMKKGVLSKRAVSAQEALTLMETDRFQLVFLDAKLPDMEGLELARRLRRVDSTIPIIMVSGYFYGEESDIRKAVAEGLIQGFIGKPFVHKEITKMIEIVPP